MNASLKSKRAMTGVVEDRVIVSPHAIPIARYRATQCRIERVCRREYVRRTSRAPGPELDGEVTMPCGERSQYICIVMFAGDILKVSFGLVRCYQFEHRSGCRNAVA